MKKIIFILFIFFYLAPKLSYADGWLSNGLGGYYYISSTTPAATENEVEALFAAYDLDIENFRSQFYWFDTTNNAIYDYVDGENGSFIWTQRGGGSAPRIFNAIFPILNSVNQISSTRDCQVFYSVDIQTSSLLLGTASGTVYLEYADDSNFTSNVMTLAQGNNSISGVLNSINKQTVTLSGIIPAAKYQRIRTVINSGTVSFTALVGQQILL
ncbi:MAG: hypothetical protein ULS35scaffold63_40 [Phage 33_17]|nr:MAG: hypothetical protein ULS35scaffold63_40 [Phage 33_17]